MTNPFEVLNTRLGNMEVLLLEACDRLTRMAEAPPKSQPESSDELLTVRQAADLLHVCPQTVHDFKKRGLLTFQKIGRRTLLRRTDVLAALTAHTRTEKPGKGTKAAAAAATSTGKGGCRRG